jgi:predicted molibdopterin-dependent oxidoreductase YjgC
VSTKLESLKDFHHHLLRIREKFGPLSIAGIITDDVTNEGAYLFQKFFRTCLGSSNLYVKESPDIFAHPMFNCMNSLSISNPTPPWESIYSSDVIILINRPEIPFQKELLAELMARYHKKAIAFFDPEVPAECDLQIFPLPPQGISDVLRLFLWIAHSYGCTDRQVIWHDKDGFQNCLKNLRTYDIKSVAAKWHLCDEALKDAALSVIQKLKVSVLFNAHCNSDPDIDRTHQDALNLSIASGHFGTEGSGMFFVPLYSNSTGIFLSGCSSRFLPGALPITLESARNWYSSCWNCELPPERGLDFNELSSHFSDNLIKALIVLGDLNLQPYMDINDQNKLLSKVELIAGAGLTQDPRFHYWWQLAPFESRSGTRITFDRKLKQLPNSSRTDTRLQDWNVVFQWINCFACLDSKITSFEEIFKEMSASIPPLFNLTPSALAEMTHYWNPFADALLTSDCSEADFSQLHRIRFQQIHPLYQFG